MEIYINRQQSFAAIMALGKVLQQSLKPELFFIIPSKPCWSPEAMTASLEKQRLKPCVLSCLSSIADHGNTSSCGKFEVKGLSDPLLQVIQSGKLTKLGVE